jgi:hypothetical protein
LRHKNTSKCYTSNPNRLKKTQQRSDESSLKLYNFVKKFPPFDKLKDDINFGLTCKHL